MSPEDKRTIKRKLRVLEHAEHSGNITKSCRYFGIPRSLFYLWRRKYRAEGERGLINMKPSPKNMPNQTPQEIVDKVLHLRRKYHLGPMRIVWYMARYHDIRISDATVYRILRRNGLNRLPRKFACTQSPYKTISEKSARSSHPGRCQVLDL